MNDPIRKQITSGSQPTSPDQLLAILDELRIDHTTVEHPPMFTVEQSKKFRTTSSLGSYTKNLFLRNKKGLMWLITCSEDTRLDLYSVATCLQSGHLSFGSPDRLMKYLGVKPGAISPFALINDSTQSVSFVFEKELTRQPLIHLHPLINTQTTSIATKDLIQFAGHIGHAPRHLCLEPSETPATTTPSTRVLNGTKT
jgi:Ala-tRNA(Pro) deacylase